MTDMLDLTFAALADPTRRAILAQLASGEATVGELAKPFAISLPAISRHLKVLEQASLIERRRDGQMRRCRLDPRPLDDAAEWLTFYRKFWNASLDRLAAHLATTVEGQNHARPRRPKRPRR
jgi:DNA-binding transcriptional ArsR family regulator